MAQVVREAGIEVGGGNDPEILDPKAEVRRWVAVPVVDVDGGVGKGMGVGDGVDVEALKRKLSVGSGRSQAPRDETAGGVHGIET